MHPTSLPGDFGIGDCGPEAYRFVDFLAESGQGYWQILPLSPTGQGNSPYSAYSAFAGNTLLISPEKLVEEGLISPERIKTAPKFAAGRVDFRKAKLWKDTVLGEAFDTFRSRPDSELSGEFEYFCNVNSWWLDDYALFRSLKASQGEKAWFDWAPPLKTREKAALETVRSQLAREVKAERFFQYLFFRQWLAVRKYANEKGIRIVGDIPIFVALDSADVWCNQDQFKLNEDGSPKVVAGVPPDYFSKTGQNWGNPIYDWEAMETDNFGWWTARISFSLMTVDIVRLDHFIGFSRNWEIPAKDKTAENGRWVDVPGGSLFTVLKQRLGELPMIAEDLGAMTPLVEQLRDGNDFPGMRILHNAFGGDARNRDLPHNFIQHCVAYTGTHDNDTTVGWYRSVPPNVRRHCREYLRSSGREMHWEMIRVLMASVADMAIVPAQDILGLGSEARMNTPATASGNWEWRIAAGHLDSEIAARLMQLADIYGRMP
ncbi:4-alpha-glucanotransferase [soil metagenome]